MGTASTQLCCPPDLKTPKSPGLVSFGKQGQVITHCSPSPAFTDHTHPLLPATVSTLVDRQQANQDT